MISTRESVLGELMSRLSQIRLSNGYATDAGGRVYIGEEPMLGEGDPEASIAVIVPADEPGYEGENVYVTLPVEVQAIVKVGTGAWATVEKIVADIKRAVEQDHDFGKRLVYRGLSRGQTVPMDKDPGSQFVGAVVTYRLSYQERWGQP